MYTLKMRKVADSQTLSNKNARYTYIMCYLLVVYVHVQHPGRVFRKTKIKTVCKFPWQILPRKTTCPLKIHGWNRIHFLLSWSRFMFDIRSLSVGVCGLKSFPETTIDLAIQVQATAQAMAAEDMFAALQLMTILQRARDICSWESKYRRYPPNNPLRPALCWWKRGIWGGTL